MKRPLACLLVTLGVLAAFPASARVITLDSAAEVPDASFDTQLRSAFFLRGSGLDRGWPAASAEERTSRLRRHFDVVLSTLIVTSERSLDVALARLESAQGSRWTPAERQAWRRTLAQRRLANIRRLRSYQVRGRFPQNEHVADRAVPVFVDNHDTACAVGHLMRMSGWADAVAAIQRANNLVYVTDVHDGPLVAWVLVSGLTHEEAALIQPAYEPPPFDQTLDVLTAGASITKNGLVFDNFKFVGGPLLVPELFPAVPPIGNVVDLTQAGATVLHGIYSEPFFGNYLEPVFDDWLFIGGREFGGLIDSMAGQDWGVIYSFDVMPLAPGMRIAAASLESQPNFNFNFFSGGGIDVETQIFAGSGMLPPALAGFHLSSDSTAGSFFLYGQEQASFPPQQKVTVVTAARIADNAKFTSLVHSFELIPEPTAVALALVGCLLALAQRRVRSGAAALN